MITVFYDGACGLCKKEIGLYRRLDKAQRIAWVDISQSSAELDRHGIDPLAAMYELHVLDGFARLYRGVEGFLAIWRELPYFQYIAPIVALPGARQLARLAYRVFVWWHVRKLNVCYLDNKPPT